ncbi:biotin--[acetyl-CoA-carboxylase] ligase [bacterium]|nr:biotin--[acetyl-CoA-carboxylase] ligase [bacterium]
MSPSNSTLRKNPSDPSDPFEAAQVDLLLPASSPFRNRTTIVPSLPSTQDYLRASLPPPPAVLAAETQTAGHGRQGKAWISEKPLGLWVSLLLETSPSHLPLLSLLGSLAAADAVRTLTRLEPSLKWPNDLLLQNRKLAGLLVETVSRKNQPPLALLGLGLNLHQQASDSPRPNARRFFELPRLPAPSTHPCGDPGWAKRLPPARPDAHAPVRLNRNHRRCRDSR